MLIPDPRIYHSNDFYFMILLFGLSLYVLAKQLYPSGFFHVFERKESEILSFYESSSMALFMFNYAMFLSAIALLFLENRISFPDFSKKAYYFILILTSLFCFWAIKRLFRTLVHKIINWPIDIRQTYGVYNLYRSKLSVSLFFCFLFILYSKINHIYLLGFIGLIFVITYSKLFIKLYSISERHIPIYSFALYIFLFEILPLSIGGYQLLNMPNFQ